MTSTAPSATLRQALPFMGMGVFIVLWMVITLSPVTLTRNDFVHEAWPAYVRLLDGDFAGFWSAAPGYLTFTVVFGAPAALAGDLLGASRPVTYLLIALPGALALGGVAGWLAAAARQAGRRSWWIVLLVAAGVIVGRQALRIGHPEDVLATGASVGAVLLALHGRDRLATIALVVAVLAKQWAVLAVLPAALASPRRGARIALVAGVATVVTIGAQMRAHPMSAATMTSTGEIFYQYHWWYPLGSVAEPGSYAAKHGMLAPPSWLLPLTHPLVAGLAVPLSGAWWLFARRRGRPREDALGLLALLFLLRAVLDPWDIPYYLLPLVVSLTAWHVRTGRGIPWLAIATLVAIKVSFGSDFRIDYTGMDDYALFVAWTVPLAIYIIARAWGILPARRGVSRAAVRVRPRMPAAEPAN